jgi:hypothetical protein
MQEIKDYIELFYKRHRKQAQLDYLSLAVFERRFYENLKAEVTTQVIKKGLQQLSHNPLFLLERETGFGPATFSLGS